MLELLNLLDLLEADRAVKSGLTLTLHLVGVAGLTHFLARRRVM